MPQHEVRFSETIDAPREQVFAFFADHEKFATLFGGSCRRVKDGDDPNEPNGLGSVRRMGAGPLAFEETIVAFERPERIDYRVTMGSPLKNHLGKIEFRSRGDSTTIDYVIRFDAKVPGTGGLIAKLLSKAWKRSAPRVLRRLEAGG